LKLQNLEKYETMEMKKSELAIRRGTVANVAMNTLKIAEAE
jgi:hypothetical protein